MNLHISQGTNWYGCTMADGSIKVGAPPQLKITLSQVTLSPSSARLLIALGLHWEVYLECLARVKGIGFILADRG